MPSVGTYKAQPVTRSFVVTQDVGNSEYGAYYFTESDVDTWYSNNSDNLTKVTSSLYVVKSGNFANIVQDLNDSGSFDRKRSLIDMGKEIVIGNTVQSRLVVLRKVQEASPPADGGDGITAYIVVENNYRSANWPTPSDSQLNVNVARV
jgi:hypothetical protein